MTYACIDCAYQDECPGTVRSITKPANVLRRLKGKSREKVANRIIERDKDILDEISKGIVKKLGSYVSSSKKLRRKLKSGKTKDLERNQKVDALMEIIDLIQDTAMKSENEIRQEIEKTKLGDIAFQEMSKMKYKMADDLLTHGAFRLAKRLEDLDKNASMGEFKEKVCMKGIEKKREKDE